MLIGARRAGPTGAVLAWLAFTTPSALLLAALGIALRNVAQSTSPKFTLEPSYAGALDGLGAAAAAVVLLAAIQLGRNLLVNRAAQAIGAGALLLALGVERFAPGFQWAVLVCGGIAGALLRVAGPNVPASAPPVALSRRVAVTAAAIFAVFLFGLPIVATPGSYLDLFAIFFRAGSLVFGGGHVVLPFLASLIGPSHVSTPTFFAGYGAAQAVPGPLFTFAAFLGGVDTGLGGPLAALVAILGIFAPSFLLLAAVLPLWNALRGLPHAASTLAGLNAAVVGLLAAAFVDPIATTLARHPVGIGLAIVAFALLQFARMPAWAVVLLSAALGAAAGTFFHVPR